MCASSPYLRFSGDGMEVLGVKKEPHRKRLRFYLKKNKDVQKNWQQLLPTYFLQSYNCPEWGNETTGQIRPATKNYEIYLPDSISLFHVFFTIRL